ncbi:MAG: serine/threonine protein kinase, partial [Myxococcota bacterium]|nr:serine/threonine protein kinase [Myxococcota bacterium]
MTSPPHVPTSAHVIAGRYLLREQIGAGGMGSIWRAEHLMLQRPVAVKFLDGHASRERFLREARVAAAVQHRNVVQIMDFGADADGRPFMVMELLSGRTLGDRMREGPPPLAETIRIVARTLSGLAAVHEAGIVHRDLKPENIFIVREGEHEYPKLLDFGISRVTVPDRGVTSVVKTRESLIVGTPQYMSPEQARGSADIDARSDLYAIGTLLYELLTGLAPHDAELPGDVLAMILTQDPVPLRTYRPDLPPAIVAVVERAMSRDRALRFPSATEMRAALMLAAAEVAEHAGGSFALADDDSIPPPVDRGAILDAGEAQDATVASARLTVDQTIEAIAPPAAEPSAAAAP